MALDGMLAFVVILIVVSAILRRRKQLGHLNAHAAAARRVRDLDEFAGLIAGSGLVEAGQLNELLLQFRHLRPADAPGSDAASAFAEDLVARGILMIESRSNQRVSI